MQASIAVDAFRGMEGLAIANDCPMAKSVSASSSTIVPGIHVVAVALTAIIDHNCGYE